MIMILMMMIINIIDMIDELINYNLYFCNRSPFRFSSDFQSSAKGLSGVEETGGGGGKVA